MHVEEVGDGAGEGNTRDKAGGERCKASEAPPGVQEDDEDDEGCDENHQRQTVHGLHRLHPVCTNQSHSCLSAEVAPTKFVMDTV